MCCHLIKYKVFGFKTALLVLLIDRNNLLKKAIPKDKEIILNFN